jgi:hypothetical protein
MQTKTMKIKEKTNAAKKRHDADGSPAQSVYDCSYFDKCSVISRGSFTVTTCKAAGCFG